MEEIPRQVKVVSLPESLFLELIWGCRDKVIFDSSFQTHKALIEQLTQDKFCHIEREKAPSTIVTVWRLSDWYVAEERYKKQREGMEARIAAGERRKELKARLVRGFEAKLGAMPGNELLAEQVLNMKNTIMAELAGLSKEEIKEIEGL